MNPGSQGRMSEYIKMSTLTPRGAHIALKTLFLEQEALEDSGGAEVGVWNQNLSCFAMSWGLDFCPRMFWWLQGLKLLCLWGW